MSENILEIANLELIPEIKISDIFESHDDFITKV